MGSANRVSHLFIQLLIYRLFVLDITYKMPCSLLDVKMKIL